MLDAYAVIRESDRGPKFATPVLRAIAEQGYNVDNAIAVYRSEQSDRLARMYLICIALAASPLLVALAREVIFGKTALLAALVMCGIYLLAMLLCALLVENLLLNHLLGWHMSKRFPAERCWEMLLERRGGPGTLPGPCLYTEHPLLSPTVESYLSRKGFTASDREVADVLLGDGSDLTLEQLVSVAQSLR